MSIYQSLFLSLTIAISHGLGGRFSNKDLPNYFPRCSRNDPNLNKCLLNAGMIVKPYLIRGIPELEIPPLNPYKMPDVGLEQQSGGIYFKAGIVNSTFYGLDTYMLEKLEYDVPNGRFSGRARFGRSDLKGKFTLSTRILVIPLDIDGNFIAQMNRFNATLNQDVRFITRNGVSFIKTAKVTVGLEVDPKDVKITMERLGNDSEVLDQITTDIVNRGLDAIIDEVKPLVERTISSMMKRLLERIHSNVPYDKLYPPSL